MDDWLDSVNDSLEDRAGFLGAMGGMAALNNQRASLNKLSEIKNELAKAQASAAKTEQERLALEKARIKEEKAIAEAVKGLRILMADSNSILRNLGKILPSTTGDGLDREVFKTTISLQLKLELVEKNSDILSDLADLNEHRRLKDELKSEMARLSGQRLTPDNPLDYFQRKVFEPLENHWSVLVFSDQVTELKNVYLDGKESKGYRSLSELQSWKKRLDEISAEYQSLDKLSEDSQIAFNVVSHDSQSAIECFDQIRFLRGHTSNVSSEVVINYFTKACNDSSYKHRLGGELDSALSNLEFHSGKAEEQKHQLAEALKRIKTGDYELAYSLNRLPLTERYQNPSFDAIKLKIKELDSYLEEIENTRSSASLEKAWQKLGVNSWSNSSTLKDQFIAKKEEIKRQERKSRLKNTYILLGFLSAVILLFGTYSIRANEKKSVLARAAKETREAAEAAAKETREAAEAESHRRARELEPIRKRFAKAALEEGNICSAWGGNSSDQCYVSSDLTYVVGIAAGNYHSLALKKDGTVFARGGNNSNQCDVPSGLTDVVGITAGSYHSLALKKDGTVVAWGYNGDNQCDVPSGLTDVVGIAAGSYHSLALKKDEAVVAWGSNSSNQCDVPSGLADVVGIAAGSYHSLALKKDGKVVAWGDNGDNQCDVPSGLTDVVGVAARMRHSLALKKDGTVVAWGDNSSNQCDVPSGLTDVVGIAAGDYHSLALKKDGTVVAWGDNGKGQCDVPSGLTDVVGIAAGWEHNVVLRKSVK